MMRVLTELFLECSPPFDSSDDKSVELAQRSINPLLSKDERDKARKELEDINKISSMRKSTITPITPTELRNQINIPRVIIESVNKLLKDNYNHNRITITKNDIITEACRLNNNLTRETIINKHYLDFEALYGQYGWKVQYHTPDKDEVFDDYFSFEKNK